MRAECRLLPTTPTPPRGCWRRDDTPASVHKNEEKEEEEEVEPAFIAAEAAGTQGVFTECLNRYISCAARVHAGVSFSLK